jgi:hypothetical protein
MATTITPTIVTVNTTVTVAPTPSQLQQSGAMISVGGTSLATGTYQYCGQLSALQGILLSSGSGNYVELNNMGTTFFAQGDTVGTYVLELGTQGTAAAGIAALQAWITSNPGVFYSYLVPAAWDNAANQVGSIQITSGGSGYTAAPTVTFAGGGGGSGAAGTAVIQGGSVVSVTITNPGTGYTATPTITFSAPTSGTTATGTVTLASALAVLVSNYASPTGKTYFFVTTTSTNIVNYAPNKSAYARVASPTAVSTEFQAATAFYQWLNNRPAANNKLAPMAYRFAFGVTPWAKPGNGATINTVLTNYGNVILTGSEGGISDACEFKGTLMDGSQASWWYGIDWFQIQVKQAMAAAIINGSNQQPPLLYDQPGINALLAVAEQVAANAVTFGCALSITVTAIPFATYTTENPNDYKAGQYGGFSATAVGQNGFLTITFQLDAVEFA